MTKYGEWYELQRIGSYWYVIDRATKVVEYYSSDYDSAWSEWLRCELTSSITFELVEVGA